MTSQQAPAGMIPVEEFSKIKGIAKEKIIAMLRDPLIIS